MKKLQNVFKPSANNILTSTPKQCALGARYGRMNPCDICNPWERASLL